MIFSATMDTTAIQIIITITLFHKTLAIDVCPSGGKWHYLNMTDKCYIALAASNIKTWYGAKWRCGQKHPESDLVIIKDATLQQFIETIKKAATAWIGGTILENSSEIIGTSN